MGTLHFKITVDNTNIEKTLAAHRRNIIHSIEAAKKESAKIGQVFKQDIKAVDSFYGNQDVELTKIKEDFQKAIASSKKSFTSSVMEYEKAKQSLMKDGGTNESSTTHKADIGQLAKENTDGTDESIKAAEIQRKNALSSLRQQAVEESEILQKLIDDLASFSTAVLRSVFKQIETFISESVDLSATDIEALMGEVNILQKGLTESNPFTVLSKAHEEYNKACNCDKKDDNDKKPKKKTIISDETKTQVLDLSGAITGMLGDVGVEIPKGLKDGINGLDQAFEGLAGIDVKNPLSIITGVVKIAGGLGKVVGSIFGAGRKLISQKEFDQYANLMSVINQVLVRQKEVLKKLVGQAAVDQADKAKELTKKQTEASKKLGKKYLNSGASSSTHSFGVRNFREIKKYKDDINKLGIDFDSLGGRVTGLFDLSAEQLLKLKEELPEMWASLDEKTRGFLDAIIQGAVTLEEIENIRKESLTGMSYDSLKNSLDSLLTSADLTFSDIGDSFESHMSNAILNVIKQSILDEGLKKWYEEFAEAMEDGELSREEADALRKKYEKTVKESNEAYKNAMAAAGLDLPDSSSREGTSKGIATASQESVDEVSGRLTVIQGHTFSISENIKVVTANITIMLSHVAGIHKNTNRLEAIEGGIVAMRSDINKLATKGIVVI